MRTAMLLAVVVLIGAGIGIGLKQATSGDDGATPARALTVNSDEARARLSGAPAPIASLHARAGDLLPGAKDALDRELAKLDGHPAVVNVWASWCGPCIEEAPVIQRVSLDRGKEVGFLGVDLRDSRDGAMAFLKRFPVTFPSIEDPEGEVYNDYKLLGQPATAFYDASGERTYIHQGPYESPEAFDADVRRYALGASS